MLLPSLPHARGSDGCDLSDTPSLLRKRWWRYFPKCMDSVVDRPHLHVYASMHAFLCQASSARVCVYACFPLSGLICTCMRLCMLSLVRPHLHVYASMHAFLCQASSARVCVYACFPLSGLICTCMRLCMLSFVKPWRASFRQGRT